MGPQSSSCPETTFQCSWFCPPVSKFCPMNCPAFPIEGITWLQLQPVSASCLQKLVGPEASFSFVSLCRSPLLVLLTWVHPIRWNPCCCVQLFATPWIAACQASLPFTISWSLLKLISIELVMPSNHLILCSPLLLLPSIFSSIRVFSNELALPIRWPMYWSFSIISSSENSGLISFSIYWLNLFAVQGTLKSLLHHHSSKPFILQCSAFFMFKFSHPDMTTGKTIPLTIQTFVSKVMSLLLNMLSRLVIAFLSRRKRLLISWL